MNAPNFQCHASPQSLTVIIPNFNHGHFIGAQLQAILSQSVQPTKIIIVDDSSTDESVSTIRQLIAHRPNIELVCKKQNTGAVATINEGLRLADSEFVTCLAADDVVLPGLFEKSLALLTQHPGAALCSAISYVEHDSGDSIIPNSVTSPCSTSAFIPPNRVRSILMRTEGWFMGNTTILRLKPLLSIGAFPGDLSSYSDGFVYSVLALKHGACFIPEPLAVWRRRDSGHASSTNRDTDAQEQILTAINFHMKNSYPDLFPSELAARINGRVVFKVICAYMDKTVDRVRAAVEVAQPTVGGSYITLVASMLREIARILFYCVLRPGDVPQAILCRLWIRRTRRIRGTE